MTPPKYPRLSHSCTVKVDPETQAELMREAYARIREEGIVVDVADVMGAIVAERVRAGR